jgi:uncharacterized protein (TIGR00251 family)
VAADWYSWQGDALLLKVRVQPRASRDEIAGPQGQYLKIRLTAPPVDGKANQTLVKFMAKICGVPNARISLLSGAGSRNKRLRIDAPRLLPAGIQRPRG